MKSPELFKKYIWLVNSIYHSRGISLSDLSNRWMRTEMSGGMPLSRSTFNRHKDAIEDMFGIIIDCDMDDDYKYYIGNPEVLRENTVQNWMLTTLSVSSLISESMSLQRRIVLENVPSGGHTLRQIIQAMKANRLLSVTYRRYGTSSSKTFTVAAYCVKLFHQRWYMVAKSEKRGLAVFSLDRIESLSLLTEKFVIDEHFDATSFFSECFGVVVGDGSQPVRILLRAYGNESNYMRDLPIHPSQRELTTDDGHTDFELTLRPTSDFKAHLLSRGEWIQVLEPQSLADEIVEWHQKAIDRYLKKPQTTM